MTPPPDLDQRQALLDRLQADPDGYESNLEMGLYCAKHRDLLMQAEPFLLKALAHNRIEEKTEPLLVALGEIQLRRGNPEAAVATFRTLTQIFPHHPNHAFLLGDAITATGAIDEASRVYRAAFDALAENARRISQKSGRPAKRILSPAPTLHRHLGEIANSLDLFLKARALGLIEPFEAVLIAPEDDTANPSFVDCLREHVTVLTAPDEIEDAYVQYGDCPYFINYVPLPDGRVLQRDLAYGTIQRLWSDQDRPPMLELPESLADRGRKALRLLGLEEDDWFTCLHIREQGFYDERDGIAATQNRYRNVKVENYLPAVRRISERGGWVLRMGDPSATPLPEMDRAIDYARSDVKSPWLDIFLLASCRFFLGTRAGPLDVARAFGVPYVATDLFPPGQWNFRDCDIFLTKLLVDETTNRVLSIGEAMRPPFFGAWNPVVYQQHGIAVIDNTADEIAEATGEMLDHLEGRRDARTADAPLLAAYTRSANPHGLGHLVPISPAFLRRHPELAADPPPGTEP